MMPRPSLSLSSVLSLSALTMILAWFTLLSLSFSITLPALDPQRTYHCHRWWYRDSHFPFKLSYHFHFIATNNDNAVTFTFTITFSLFLSLSALDQQRTYHCHRWWCRDRRAAAARKIFQISSRWKVIPRYTFNIFLSNFVLVLSW